MLPPTIRRAEREDLEGFLLLYRRLLRYHEELDTRFKLDLVGLASLWDIVRGMLRSRERCVWLAEREERLVGFVTGRVMQGPGGTHFGFIGDIFVGEPCRRQGLGTELFRALRQELVELGARSLQLQVAKANVGPRAFWERLGFSEYMDNLWLDLAEAPWRREARQDMRIRPAEGQDVAEFRPLWRELAQSEAAIDGRASLEHQAEEVFRRTVPLWMERDDAQVLVAEANGRVLGYAIGLIHENVPVFSLARYGQLSDIYVGKPWRAKGIAIGLYGTLENWFRTRAVSVVQTNVLHGDAATQRFFRSLGFEDYMLHLWLDLEGKEL